MAAFSAPFDPNWEEKIRWNGFHQEEGKAWRFLAGDDPVRVDYSVLSVGVMTLGLVLVVEVLRHRIDHAAEGRPFFKAVLEGVYSELATLGIVEVSVYLLNTYYEDLDQNKYYVFTDIHFALFYTAIFNAFQTVIVAVVSTRVSRRKWVDTEMLELNHYVEIREEFEIVERQLKHAEEKTKKSNSKSTSPPESVDSSPEKDARLSATVIDEEELWSRQGWGELLRSIAFRIRYPGLRRKYHKLLIQIRFHELRVHFLTAYSLPPKLKVSDYLMRREQKVLITLVHVSSVAWLLLTGAVNILYFFLGIVSYERQDPSYVGTALIWIFFLSMGLFVVLAFLLYRKMTKVFQAIMLENHLWDVHNVQSEERERLAEQQLALFWGGDPKLVIAAIQFVQFGFANCLSVVIIFWEDIDDGRVNMHMYLLALAICYVVFVLVTSHVIPRYTLCTSLAQLVHQKTLDETLADFWLENAKRKHLQQKFTEDNSEEFVAPQVEGPKVEKVEVEKAEGPTSGVVAVLSGAAGGMSSAFDRTINTMFQRTQPVEEPKVNTDRSSVSSDLAGLVTLETDMLRSFVPRDQPSEPTNRSRSRNRRRAKSEGVAEMASMGPTTPHSHQVEDNTSHHGSGLATQKRPRRNRVKSSSDGVALMASMTMPVADTPQMYPEVPTTPVQSSSFDNVLPSPLTRPLTPTERLEHLNHNRDRVRQLRGIDVNRAEMAGANNPVALSGFVTNRQVPSVDIMSELVKSNTKSLRAMLPEHERAALSQRDEERANRRNRRRAKSEDVAAMAAIGRATPSFPDRSPEARRRARRNRKSLSDGVAFMALHRSELAGTNVTSSVLEDAKLPAIGSPPDGIEEPKKPVSPQTSKLPREEPSKTLENSGKVTFEDIPDDPRLLSGTASCDSYLSEDEHSDVDDVPDVDASRINQVVVSSDQRPSLRVRLRSYFLSKKFVVVSNVFGTMVAFFLVGQRIERFLHTEGIIPPYFVSFDMDNEFTFWFLMSLFVMFLCGDALIFYAVRPWGGSHERKAVVAAALDVTIVATCVAVFVTAEAKRCCDSCHDLEGRDLAKDPYSTDGYAKDSHSADPVTCGCPSFGKRLCGGLGMIEPYISLVGLRVFRHWLAKRLSAEPKPSAQGNVGVTVRGLNLEPLAVFDDSGDGGHGQHGHGQHGHGHGEENGTAAELWKAAVVQHPELVAKYGEFSGEVLKAMLGLQTETDTPDLAVTSMHDDSVTDHDAIFSELDNGPKPKQYALGKEYAGLSSEAQGIIMAGKLGHSVRQVATFGNQTAGSEFPPGGQFRFELDRSESEKHNLVDFEFTCPDAPLVRSMRRCDRILLPILDKWTVVDVVLTRFEMVYFDASHVDATVQDPFGERVKKALSATKGGKGLRLCDVAGGRRVVGHLELSDIESVTVERRMPFQDDKDIAADGPEIEVEWIEYWKGHQPQQGKDVDVHSASRTTSWKKIKQDRLRIQTVHNRTLYLRFYSDLEDAKHHPDRLASENEYEGPISKNDAFLWVQTIGRFCGPDQLKQSLPHFGDDSVDELRDYLVVHHSGVETDGKKGRPRSHGLLKVISNRRSLDGSDRRRWSSGEAGSPARASPSYQKSASDKAKSASWKQSRRSISSGGADGHRSSGRLHEISADEEAGQMSSPSRKGKVSHRSVSSVGIDSEPPAPYLANEVEC